jgi:hypothetical protein
MSLRTKIKRMVLLLLCVVGCATQASAAHDEALTFTIENDLFTHSDNNYTDGVGISWLSADLNTYADDSFISKWGRFWEPLPFVLDEGYTTYASWSVVQEMYTPDSITNPNPPEDDQPYAGILYVDSLLYARKERWQHAWEIKLGVVGPSSLAEGTQKRVHKLIGSEKPQGWHTQLPDEPVVNLGYTVAHLAAEGNACGLAEWRIVPVGTIGLGTYFTGAGLGIYGEVGWNLTNAFGGASLRSGFNAASTVGAGPVNGWSASFFGGLGGFGVIHYLPVDGTVFKDSRSVDSEPFIGTASYGFSMRHGRFTLNCALTYFTDTFKTERKNDQFGTVSLSWFF